MHLGAVGSLEMLNRFPTIATVSVQGVPVQLAHATKGRDNLLQLAQLEAEEDVLEFGTVEVQPDAITCGGHARARVSSSVASAGRRCSSPQAPSPQPKRGPAMRDRLGSSNVHSWLSGTIATPVIRMLPSSRRSTRTPMAGQGRARSRGPLP